MLRRLSVVFMIGAMLPRPCAAADAGESVVRLLSPEMRRLCVEEQALQDELRTLPPAPERETTARLGYHSAYARTQDTVEWVDMDLKQRVRNMGRISSRSTSF